MRTALMQSEIPGLPVRRGKVRDVYELDAERLLIVASDRISAFDVIMPTPVPDKGKILTRLSNFWFEQFGSRKIGNFAVKAHLLATRVEEFPASLRAYREQLEGRAVRITIEAVEETHEDQKEEVLS